MKSGLKQDFSENPETGVGLFFAWNKKNDIGPIK